MTWYAKPNGAYSNSSNEAHENWKEIANFCVNENGWTLESCCGMLGNMGGESGWNPWRWQSDSVSLTDEYKGYGLVQFTPAYGYINNYGVGVTDFSPNLSVTSISKNATPKDGHAQLIVINEDRAGKFLNRSAYCKYADISTCYPFSEFKKVTDLWIATIGWLFNYEFPAEENRTEEKAKKDRYSQTLICYNYLKENGFTSGLIPNIDNAILHGGVREILRRCIIHA